MKRLLLSIALATALLSACIGPPKIDFSRVESECAQRCASNHSTCMSGFKMFPLVAESQCNDAMETCAKTCPAKTVAATPAQLTTPSSVAPASATERMKELDAMYKNGLISKDEYEGKRQEILKAM